MGQKGLKRFELTLKTTNGMRDVFTGQQRIC